MSDARSPVLLYDGECGLCNALVRALLRRDRTARLRFASLQSDPGQAYLKKQGLPLSDFDSLVFVPDWNNPAPGGYRLRTDGALAAIDEIGGFARTVSCLRLVPLWMRDLVYRAVAALRYGVFGTYRPRPLPDPSWKQRFLMPPDGA